MSKIPIKMITNKTINNEVFFLNRTEIKIKRFELWLYLQMRNDISHGHIENLWGELGLYYLEVYLDNPNELKCFQ